MRALIVMVLVVSISPAAHAAIINVPDDQSTIQEGLNAASAGDIVVIACGTYYEHDIVMKSGVHLRSETGQPDCVTVDAELQGRGFLCSALDSSTQLEGITVTQGRAVGGYPAYFGGGMYCNGGSPVLMNMVFSSNYAGSRGGGLCCRNEASPTLTGVLFQGNNAVDHGGGIDFWLCPSAQLTDVVFARNIAQYGGAISCYGSSPTLTNVTFARNTATDGGGVYCSHWSNPTIANSILSFGLGGYPVYCFGRGEPDVSQCVVFGDAQKDTLCGPASGVLELDPRFCDIQANDYTLCANSPCLPTSPDNPWGVLIGALGEGCADCDSPVEARSWGSIKALYR